VPKESSEQVIAKAKSLFGSRVSMPEFRKKASNPEGEDLDEKHVPDLRSKHTVKVDRTIIHCQDEADKATVIVVCPSLAARYAGMESVQAACNDHVIAVNKLGTYSFAYLDPGSTLDLSIGKRNGFKIELEAGKSYYFLQNSLRGCEGAHHAVAQ